MELLDGCGSLEVSGHQERLEFLLFNQQRELAAGGGFSRALQAAHHDGRQLAPFERQAVVDRSEEFDELLVDNLYKFLVWPETQQDPATFGGECNVFNECADDIDTDIGLDQGPLDHGDPIPHIRFGQLTFTLQCLKGAQ